MSSSARNPWLLTAALLGGLAVACGAFGAHVLEMHLPPGGDWNASLATWETAARYQMYHALALLAVGILAARRPSRCLHLAGLSFTAGTFIFSGCLYLLVLAGQRWLGAVVPLGGLLLLLGWVLLAVSAARDSSS